MEDWAVWPIFVLQGIILLLILAPQTIRIAMIGIKDVILCLLLLAALMMVIALYHDSTDYLHLYF
jgi:hypothetical protein